MLLSVVVKCSLEFINIKLIPHIKCRVWDTLQGQWLLEHWENQQLQGRSQTTIKKREVSICDRVSTVLHKAAGNTCTQQSAADLLMLSKFHFCFCIKSPEIHNFQGFQALVGTLVFIWMRSSTVSSVPTNTHSPLSCATWLAAVELV